MNKIKLLFVSCLVALTAACSSNHVDVNFDQNTNIKTTNYKTFSWLTNEKITVATPDLNPIMKARVDDSIERAFLAKGYQLVDDPKKADFTISYTVGSREKVTVHNAPVAYQFGWGRGHYRGRSHFDSEPIVRQYTEGKLAIDIYDVKTHQPVFHGWATRRITSYETESSQAFIDSIVLQIVTPFK